MWLTNSSIGRKLVMAITGACLILFVTFHCVMNSVAILWPKAYNDICLFLGANWYALVASMGLAALFIIHIIYAVWLTLQNRKARGADRYAVTSKPAQVEWASQNMLVLGIVIVAFLVLHLVQFWSKMQLAELMGNHVPDPANGIYFINEAFSCWITPVCYVIGFVALWFHMTHGFWSMFQSAGWDNNIWMPRLKCIGNWWTSIVIVLFLAQAAVFTIRANGACDCPVSTEWNALSNEATSCPLVKIEKSCCGNHEAACEGHSKGECAGACHNHTNE
ncbi:MAG: succinate dehydrogenase/fumarate reductase cytochrome b subunit [Muribaculaceae bacterium]|nr:succinate dehydrogenase/fumarate reductase cytochrome b subunit [Muribaculaceae bacterium]